MGTFRVLGRRCGDSPGGSRTSTRAGTTLQRSMLRGAPIALLFAGASCDLDDRRLSAGGVDDASSVGLVRGNAAGIAADGGVRHESDGAGGWDSGTEGSSNPSGATTGGGLATGAGGGRASEQGAGGDLGAAGSSSRGAAGGDSAVGEAGGDGVVVGDGDGGSGRGGSSNAGRSGGGGVPGAGDAEAAHQAGGTSMGDSLGGTQTHSDAGSPDGPSAESGPVVTCSNTDRSFLPDDASGKVDRACNNCGIQGSFYWYADSNTQTTLQCGGKACQNGVAPWSASSQGMCISGEATGNSEDWGAGLGLSLNAIDSGGTREKRPFDATRAACGKITGFDLTLSGNTNGMPIRIGFATSNDGSTIPPFVEVPDPGGDPELVSGATQAVITKAEIPADWQSSDPSPPDPTRIYELQLQVVAASACAGTPFELCLLSIKPITGP